MSSRHTRHISHHVQRPSKHLNDHHRSISLSREHEQEVKVSPKKRVQPHHARKCEEYIICQSATLPNSRPQLKKEYGNNVKNKKQRMLLNEERMHKKVGASKGGWERSKQNSGDKESKKKDHQGKKSGQKIRLKKAKSSQKNKVKNSPGRGKSKSKEDLAKRNEEQKTGDQSHRSQKHKVKSENNETHWRTVSQAYRPVLTLEQIQEMKQHKQIYFLGKIKERVSPRKESAFQTQIRQEKDSSRVSDSSGQFYCFQLGDHIAFRYEILAKINRGSFGEVVKVFDHKNKQPLALKIVKKSPDLVQQTFIEISILTHVKEKDRMGISGIVRIKDFTIFRNHICILFELLEGNLYELLEANRHRGLSDQAVRVFAVQMLNSLNFLQKQQIVHCDIKPENVVMRSWGKSGIKIIDFGTSCFEGKQLYEYLQSRYYRAPEIIMRKPYSFPIDMWSLGCLLAELKTGQPIFAGGTNQEQLLYISNAIGFPKPQEGIYSRGFLENDEMKQIIQSEYLQKYRKFSSVDYKQEVPAFFGRCKHLHTCMRTLESRLLDSPNFDPQFLEFLNKILLWEPQKRLKPSQALQQPWILKKLPQQLRELYSVYFSKMQTEPVTFKKSAIQKQSAKKQVKSLSRDCRAAMSKKKNGKVEFNPKQHSNNIAPSKKGCVKSPQQKLGLGTRVKYSKLLFSSEI